MISQNDCILENVGNSIPNSGMVMKYNQECIQPPTYPEYTISWFSGLLVNGFHYIGIRSPIQSVMFLVLMMCFFVLTEKRLSLTDQSLNIYKINIKS